MTCIAIIPARGGSKGIPNKNLAEVGGQSLVTRAINSAVQSGVVDVVVVSSDDPTILEAAANAGAIAIQRPADLATDTAAIEDATAHALQKFSESTQLPRPWYCCNPLHRSDKLQQLAMLFAFS